ncbi:hypothetical protein VKT23_007579 [Stygiomarasmius scandens]|uniref:Uncharacterized protein n=1 Tax=Marasmiellus scandens TaxID=2682957 RepID=A0ABR1JN27_9AGAR
MSSTTQEILATPPCTAFYVRILSGLWSFLQFLRSLLYLAAYNLSLYKPQMPPRKSEAYKKTIAKFPVRRPKRRHTIPITGAQADGISSSTTVEKESCTVLESKGEVASSPQVTKIALARPAIRPRQFTVSTSSKIVTRRSIKKRGSHRGSRLRISADMNDPRYYIRSGRALTLPPSESCPLLPATSPHATPTFKKSTLKEYSSLGLSSPTPSLIGALTLSSTILNPNSPPLTASSPVLGFGTMITREYVVDDNDLETPASAIKAAIERDFELDEQKIDRTLVPKKARKVLGMPTPVHPALGAGW